MTLTVTHLAKACNLARSTVLYYESIGLLTRPRRSQGNYRVYTEKDLGRLRQICIYRDAGLKLTDIRSVLDAPRNDASAILRRRFVELSEDI
jgi:DNA-binding transcriptional MerR regulator